MTDGNIATASSCWRRSVSSILVRLARRLPVLKQIFALQTSVQEMRHDINVLTYHWRGLQGVVETHKRYIWYLEDLLPTIEHGMRNNVSAEAVALYGDASVQDDPIEMGRKLGDLKRYFANVDPLYQPNSHWEFYNARISNLLLIHGLSSFKQTINWYYFQFRVKSEDDWLLTRVRLLQDRLPDAKLPVLRTPWIYANAYEAKLNVEYVGKLHNYALSMPGADTYRDLEEPLPGQPAIYDLEGKRISPDLTHSWLEFRHLSATTGESFDGKIVAELGAGYGRFAYVLGKLTKARIWIFDVSPSLSVSEWYLTRCFPDEKIFSPRQFDDFSEIEAELNECRIAFFYSDQIEKIPDRRIDSFVTISSLHEMSRPQVNNYMAQMGRTSATWIYLKQWQSSIAHLDNDIISQNEYTAPAGFETVSERLTPQVPSFFEKILRRRSTSGDK